MASGKVTMQVKTLSIVSSIIIGILMMSFAQDCNAILQHGITNQLIIQTRQNSYEEARNSFCKSYNSYKEGGSTFGLGSAGSGLTPQGLFESTFNIDFSNSQTKRQAELLCENTVDIAQNEDARDFFAQTIDQNAIAAWNTCNKLKDSGIEFSPQFNEIDQTVIVSLRYVPIAGSDEPETRRVNEIYADSNDFTCQGELWDLAKSGGGEIGNAYMSMECKRILFDEPKRYIDGMVRAEPATLTISTEAAKSFVLTFLPVYDFTPYADRIELLETQVATLQNSIPLASRCTIRTSTTSNGSTFATGSTAMCEPGEVVTGGACEVVNGYAGTASKITIQDSKQGYQCLVEKYGVEGDAVAASAICCR
jgi:hypothetical protein